MIDQRMLAREPGRAAELLSRRGMARGDVLEAAEMLCSRNELKTEVDELRRNSNQFAKQNQGILAGTDEKVTPEQAQEARDYLKRVKEAIQSKQEALAQLEIQVEKRLSALPNIPDNKTIALKHSRVISQSSVENSSDIPSLMHDTIGQRLKIFDPEGAARISGAGFSLLMGDGAHLLRALEDLGLDLHREKYREVCLPHLVNGRAMWGSGHLPKFRNGVFEISQSDLWGSPTAEVPLVALHQDQRLPFDKLPLCYVANAICFRSEIGSAGIQARGLRRLHEYHQVELMRICAPSQAEENFSMLLKDATRALDVLELPYREVSLSVEDMPFAAARAVRIDVYSRGGDDWLPVSTASLFSDFQARRSNIRYYSKDESGLAITMNASAMAASRLWGIILEHGLQGDGRVRLPEALRATMKKEYLEPYNS